MRYRNIIFYAVCLDKFIRTFSADNFAIPYGSTGLGISLSLKGCSMFPYLAIEEQKTILLTFCCIAAVKTEIEPEKIFFVIKYGKN